MKILSIDTSSKICSVAVLSDTNVIIEKHIDDERTHSQKLMPLVDDVLKACRLNANDFDLYVSCIGPGSFTGVRIGVATIKAFNDVTNIAVTGISSLESLAYNTLNSNFCEKADLVCSIIDAKNDNVYFGLFKKQNNTFKLVEDLNAKNIDEMIEILNNYKSSPILFVGDGAKFHEYKILEHFQKAIFVEDKLNNQSAINLGIAGFHHYNNGEFGDSNSLSPLYLRKSQAERALEGEK